MSTLHSILCDSASLRDNFFFNTEKTGPYEAKRYYRTYQVSRKDVCQVESESVLSWHRPPGSAYREIAITIPLIPIPPTINPNASTRTPPNEACVSSSDTDVLSGL